MVEVVETVNGRPSIDTIFLQVVLARHEGLLAYILKPRNQLENLILKTFYLSGEKGFHNG